MFSIIRYIIELLGQCVDAYTRSENGSVWSWKVDHLTDDNYDVRKIPIDANIVQLACGKQHFLALSCNKAYFA